MDVQVKTTIDRPGETVAGYLFDWRNDTEWIGGITEARRVDEGEFGVGSRVAASHASSARDRVRERSGRARARPAAA